MEEKKVKQELFYEKFRAKNLAQLDLLPRIAQSIGTGDNTQNFLFYSACPGTSKTTIARILTQNYPTMEINASLESSVDVIRERIVDFCSTISVLDGHETVKYVILDEVDGFSEQAFKALRGTIEKYASNARFILTCNYLNKIPEPLQSRFLCINFEPITNEEDAWLKSKFIVRMGRLFGALKINITTDALTEFVEKNSPDMRTMYNKVQSFQQQKVTQIDINLIRQNSFSYQDLYKLIFGPIDPVTNYQYIVTNYSGQTDDVLYALGGEFVEYIRQYHFNKFDKLPGVLITIADYQAKRNLVIDPVVNCLAAIFTIQKILNS